MNRLIALFVAALIAFSVAPAHAAKKKKKDDETKTQSSTGARRKSHKGHLSGTVVSASGRRAGHARVTIRGGGRRSHPKVNAAGHFSAKIKSGSYTVSASHRSYGSGHASAAVASGGSSSVTVRLSGKGGREHLRHRGHIHHLSAKDKKKVKGKSGSSGSTSSKTHTHTKTSTGSAGSSAGPAKK